MDREELEGMGSNGTLRLHESRLQGIVAQDGKILAIGLSLGGKQPETSD